MSVSACEEIDSNEIFEIFLRTKQEEERLKGMDEESSTPEAWFLKLIQEYEYITKAPESGAGAIFKSVTDKHRRYAKDRLEQQTNVLLQQWKSQPLYSFKSGHEVLDAMKLDGEFNHQIAEFVIEYLKTGDPQFLEQKEIAALAIKVRKEFNEHYKKVASFWEIGDQCTLAIQENWGKEGFHILAIAGKHEMAVLNGIIDKTVPDRKGDFIYASPVLPTPR